MFEKPYRVGFIDAVPPTFYIQLLKTDDKQEDQPYHWTEKDYKVACEYRFVKVKRGRLKPYRR